jgi:hypothetical protein
MRSLLFLCLSLFSLISISAQESQRVDQYPPFTNIRQLSAPNSPASILNDLYINSENGGAIRASVDGFDSLLVLMNKFLQCQCPAPVCESDSFNITQSSLLFASIEGSVVSCNDTSYSFYRPAFIFEDTELSALYAEISTEEDELLGISLDTSCDNTGEQIYFNVSELLSFVNDSPFMIRVLAISSSQDTTLYATSYDGETSYSLVISNIELIGECQDEVEITYLVNGVFTTLFLASVEDLSFIIGEGEFDPITFTSTSNTSGKLKIPVQEGQNSFVVYTNDFKAVYVFQITTSTALD